MIDNAWIYALSLAVYCTAWTYFGSVGPAAASGVWFLPIYLGPMLAMLLAGIVVRKMIRIAQTYRITSIADFIASRYGKSPLLAALVTLITVVGIVPYIALQLKAVSAGYHVLTAGPEPLAAPAIAWWQDGTLLVALALAAFTIVFGTRHLDSTERHEGMVAAIAFESVVKLVAFLAVGAFVTWGLFDGMADIWSRAQAFPELRALLRLGGEDGAASFGYAQWFALTLLVDALGAAAAAPVPDDGGRMRRRAAPAAGRLGVPRLLAAHQRLRAADRDRRAGAVRPGADRTPRPSCCRCRWRTARRRWRSSPMWAACRAATGMLIVETIAVSTMVCNDLVMPSLLRLPGFGARAGGDLTRLLLNIRRGAIVAVLLLGYLYFRVAGEAYALVSIGLISFAAVAQFAPALLVGMYWRGGTRAGALGGLLGGFAVWAYTLMLPSVAKSGWIPAAIRRARPLRHRAARARAAVRPRRARQPDPFAVLEPSRQRRALCRPVALARAFGPRGEPGAALRRRLRARAVGR